MTRSIIEVALGLILGLIIGSYAHAPQNPPGEQFTTERHIGADR